MIKKSLLMFFVVSTFGIHADELLPSQTIVITLSPDEIVYKKINGYEDSASYEFTESAFVASAVEEAIQCLQRLQERLLHDLIQQWAEGLLGYLQQLLKNKVTVQIVIDGADGAKKTIYSKSI